MPRPPTRRPTRKRSKSSAVEQRPPALFERFPDLEGRLPWLGLADRPTPLEPLRLPPESTVPGRILVKREDLSAAPYGGNKIRKLETLLAEAIRQGARSVVTVGAAGSNHVVATTVWAQRLGMTVDAAVIPQPLAPYVAENVQAAVRSGCRYWWASSPAALPYAVARATLACLRRDGRLPYVVGPGGSSALGAAGACDLGLELAGQLAAEDALPADIFVPLGSGGTLVGLVLGLALSGVDACVHGVHVYHRVLLSRPVVTRHIERTIALLRSFDPTIPHVSDVGSRLVLVGDQLGAGYGHPTWEALQAVRMAAEGGQVRLETTYSGKTLAALLAHAHRASPDRTQVFVATWSARRARELPGGSERPDALPAELAALLTGAQPTP